MATARPLPLVFPEPVAPKTAVPSQASRTVQESFGPTTKGRVSDPASDITCDARPRRWREAGNSTTIDRFHSSAFHCHFRFKIGVAPAPPVLHCDLSQRRSGNSIFLEKLVVRLVAFQCLQRLVKIVCKRSICPFKTVTCEFKVSMRSAPSLSCLLKRFSASANSRSRSWY